MEDARERGELQKSYFSLLHVVVHASLSESLLKMPPGALDAVMKAVTQSASTHVDAAVRRTCLQVCARVRGGIPRRAGREGRGKDGAGKRDGTRGAE